MTFKSKILLDSVAPHGARLTTFEITIPKCVQAELNTHRILSRSSSSSRAIPVEKVIQQVLENPYIPPKWGTAKAGMQAGDELPRHEHYMASGIWLNARDEAVESARAALSIGLHKQVVNRLLEPWMWVTVIVSATEWRGFFRQRDHANADPALQIVATWMHEAYRDSEPKPLGYGDWHAPLTGDACLLREDGYNVPSISAARCARASFLTHWGVRDPAADMRLFDDTLNNDDPNHWGPMEHVARPGAEGKSYGNFVGWQQLRQVLEGSQPVSRAVS